MGQRPRLGSPTSEVQVQPLAGAPRLFGGLGCSVGVVPHAICIFDVSVGRKVIATPYSSTILKARIKSGEKEDSHHRRLECPKGEHP